MTKALEKLRDELAKTWWDRGMHDYGSSKDLSAFNAGFDAASSHLMRVIEIQLEDGPVTKDAWEKIKNAL